MKKLLPTILLLSSLFSFSAKPIFATQYFPDKAISHGTNVSASVGQYHVSISGYQSPNASVVMTTKSGVFVRSTVADSLGYFTMTDVLVTDTSALCFQAIDFKRIGESDSCVDFKGSVQETQTYKDIFLPPTIGLSKKIIDAGQDADAYGYTMPNATTNLSIEDKTLNLTADKNGFYDYTYKKVPAGVYRLSATGELKGAKSLKPTNNAILEALSSSKRLQQLTTSLVQKAANTLLQEIVFFGAIILLLLAAILFLLYKLRLQILVIIVDFFRRKPKMHHDWFLDKWQ